MNYLCGACGRSRPEECIQLIEHENERLGSFPICTDAPCSIEDVDDFTDATSDYKVDSVLE